MSFHAPHTILGTASTDVQMDISGIPTTCAPKKLVKEETANEICSRLKEFLAFKKNWNIEGSVKEFHNYMKTIARVVIKHKDNEELNESYDKCLEQMKWQKERDSTRRKPFIIQPRILQSAQKMPKTMTETETILDAMCDMQGVVNQEYYDAIKSGGMLNESQRGDIVNWFFRLGSLETKHKEKAPRNTVLFAIMYFDLVMDYYLKQPKTLDPKGLFASNKRMLAAAACYYRAQYDGDPSFQLSAREIIFYFNNKAVTNETLISEFDDDPNDELNKLMVNEGEIDAVFGILVEVAFNEKFPSYTVADFVEYLLSVFFSSTLYKVDRETKDKNDDYFFMTMVLLDRASMYVDWLLYSPCLLAATAIRLMSDIFTERVVSMSGRESKLIPKITRTLIMSATEVAIGKHEVDIQRGCLEFLTIHYNKMDRANMQKGEDYDRKLTTDHKHLIV